MTCPLPPEGWTCSREEGHGGPCAASPKMPYDTYADKILADSSLLFGIEIRVLDDAERVDWEKVTTTVSKRELRQMLVDAWISGLRYSLEIMEGRGA